MKATTKTRISSLATVIAPLLLTHCEPEAESRGLEVDDARAGDPRSPAQPIAVIPGENAARALADAGLSRLKSDHRRAVVRVRDGKLARARGVVLARGESPLVSAEQFVLRHADALGVRAGDLSTRGRVSETPLSVDRKTGIARKILVELEQTRLGLPVVGGRLRMIVQNRPDHPLTWAASDTHLLGDFRPEVGGRAVGPTAADRADALARARALVDVEQVVTRALSGARLEFATPRLVIWAQSRAGHATAVEAIEIEAEQVRGPKRWRVYVDANSGQVLDTIDLVHFEDVEGRVVGLVTDGSGATECHAPSPMALPYTDVRIVDGEAALGDADGNFTIVHPGTDPVDVESTMTGQWFEVFETEAGEPSALQSLNITPPGPANFSHADPGDAILRAEVNAYHRANELRDWVLSYNPTYPVIENQERFPIFVNRSDGFCPGNAWYNGSSINFCTSSAEFGNTAFASVVYHEYGHHLVNSAGSGQGAYGEGMSDTIAALLGNDPRLGLGFFFNDCVDPLRNADNECQLTNACSTCGNAIHACGQLISGAVWSVRNELEAIDPEGFSDTINQLTIDSILLHSGTAIDDQIVEDFLTLDDDDGQIGNGTPHRAQICAGFEAHGFSCPPLSVGMDVEQAEFAPAGEQGGPFTPGSETYTLLNFGPDTFAYTVNSDVDWLEIDTVAGSLVAGEEADITVGINAEANSLASGVHRGHVTFVNETNGIGNAVREVVLQAGERSLQVDFPLDSDPGWSTQGEWAFGVPAGQSGDPSSGATGNNVYGYNLGGDYTNSMPETHLTTTAIDCSNLTGTELRFQRWLGIESSSFDHAYVRISTNGSDWTDLWSHIGGTLLESAWTEQVFDISEYADGQSTVLLRWTMGTTDSSVVFHGWNVDDVQIWGFQSEGNECADDSECDDGLFCNGTEACTTGNCQPGAPACPGQICDEDADLCLDCAADVDCDDGLFCNGSESCVDGACQSGVQPCEDGICSEEGDVCLACEDDATCDDGVFCNGVETCGADNTCEAGTAPCGPGLCDEQAQSCLECASDGDCDDGAFCNGLELCIDAACQTGIDPCQGGSCDEVTDLCVECISDDDCDDGSFCTGEELCDSGSCTVGSAPCEAELCDEDANICNECNDDADCDDGLFCTGDEVCNAGTCFGGQPVDCDDGVSCTVDICDENTDACGSIADDAACNDGLFCTGSETCDPELDCQAGSDPCEIGFCDEGSQTCLSCVDDGDCDDGLFCNGSETCNEDGACLPGTDPCLGGCDEEANLCDTTTSEIDADTYCLRIYNWSGSTHYNRGTCSVGGYIRHASVGWNYEMLADFDVGGLQGQLSSATLHFQVTSNTGTSDVTVARQDQGDWNRGNVNYNSFAKVPWEHELGTAAIGSSGSYEIGGDDLLEVVQGWIDGNYSRDGLVLISNPAYWGYSAHVTDVRLELEFGSTGPQGPQ